MSTSELKPSADLGSAIDPTGATLAALAGMPDPAALTRLASEFFGAMPRQGEPTTIPGMPSAMPAVGAVPSMSQAGSMPAGNAPISPTVMAMPTSSAPGAASLATPSTGSKGESEPIPGFAFLSDIRSFETLSQSAGMGMPTGGGSTAPSETQARTAAAMSPAAPGVQSIPAAASVPTMAGVPNMPGMSSAGAVADPNTASRLPGAPNLGAAAGSAGPILPTGLSLSDADSRKSLNAATNIPGFSFLGDIRSLEALAQGAGMGVPTSTTSIPSESQARTAAAMSPAAPGVQAIPAGASMPAMSATPTMPGMPGMPGASHFGSLADPETAARQMGAPGMSDAAKMGEAMGGMGGSSALTMPFGLSLSDMDAPQSMGSVSPSMSAMRDPTFGFFDYARPLNPLNEATSVSPVPSKLGGLHAADISSIPFDVQSVRRDFPILQERVNGRQLIWLDNAATTQKPQSVIDRLSYFYTHENSNVHRAAHTLAARATDAYEAAREKVRRFLNASSVKEIIFVRGTTEGINLVAQSWGKRNIQKDDEIVITHLEHHANIVPWQMLCAEKGSKLRVAPVDDSGQVILEEYEKLLGPKTRLVSFSHVSNALGTVTPVRQMIEMAHRHGAKVLLDGAQSVAHTRVDMQEYDCDFFVFSGHKIFAPTGIGVVYGKSEILEHTPPWQGGGNMIADVTFEKTVYHSPPLRFEAGTGNIADAVGLGAALDYIERIGMPNISRYEHDLLDYGTEVLKAIPGVRLIGTAKEKASVLSFVLDGFRNEDVGAALAREGIAVRSGHHCAQPILRRFGVESTVRPSLAFYNTCEELDALGAAIWNIKRGYTPSMI